MFGALENLAVAIAGEMFRFEPPTLQPLSRLADELLARALAVDTNSYSAHYAKATVLLPTDPMNAIDEADRAVELNPSFAPAYFTIAAAHLLAGRPKKAIDVADQALRFFPHDPGAPLLLIIQGQALFRSHALRRVK